MKRILQFHISKGERQYVAEGVDVPIVTQGETLDALTKNLQEAVALYLEDERPEELGLALNPSILVNIELEPAGHA